MRPPFPIETNNGPSTTSAAASDVSAQRGREADEEDCPVSLPIKASGPCANSTAIALALAGALPVAASHGSRLGRAGRHR
jgi:hypothetical protein